MDRGGNPATGTVAYTVSRGPGAVDAQGRLSTSAYGTAWVVGRVNGAADSVRVAATPEGAFAASGYFGGVLAMNFDGTGKRVLASGTRPSWSPAGDRIVYQSNTLDAVLRTRTLAGEDAVLPGTPPGGWHQWAQCSPDGEWIHFCTVTPNEPRKLWRIRPDGAGLQMLVSRIEPMACYPSASPDGTRIVFSEELVANFYIKVRTLATGQESGILARGNSPSWSPTGELIAFSETTAGGNPRPVGIQVMRPDGSELRRVGDPGAGYDYSPRWSPDGRWLIAAATSTRRVHLIEVATGLVIELPQYDYFTGASWKPGAPLP